MERIYFDKQIFSHLFKREKEEYINLWDNLIQNKDKFLFCYSHGHLLDLKNDKTDIKYKELEFIEKLVRDNYLSYHAIDKKTSCYLVKPSNAFKDMEEYDKPISFATLFENIDLTFLTEEQKEYVQQAKSFISNEMFDFGFTQKIDLPAEIPDSIKTILPIGMPPMTIEKLLEYGMDTLRSMENDKIIYKDLRNIVDKYINNGKFTVKYDEIDFNDELRNSVLKKSFIDFVNNNLNPDGNKEVTDYDFFINAYFSLDLLGISKESSKTVRFRNVMNDGNHSYYGAFCDYVVSDDNGFLIKTKVMYKLLDIKTKVMHISEFISFFDEISTTLETSINVFLNLLINDLKEEIELKSLSTKSSNIWKAMDNKKKYYLGYFNFIGYAQKDEAEYIYLSRNTENLSTFYFFREYEGVVNKLVDLLGIDDNKKGKMIWEIEIQEIKEGKWGGRYWTYKTLIFQILVDNATCKIILLITFNQN